MRFEDRRLALLEATSPLDLRTIVHKLVGDQNKHEAIVEEQRSRLRAAGYYRDYFTRVRSALRRLAGIDTPIVDTEVCQEQPVFASQLSD